MPSQRLSCTLAHTRTLIISGQLTYYTRQESFQLPLRQIINSVCPGISIQGGQDYSLLVLAYSGAGWPPTGTYVGQHAIAQYVGGLDTVPRRLNVSYTLS